MKKSARNHKGGERDTEKETSLLSVESRPPTRKPDNYINLTNPAARAAFGRVLRQIMGGACHGI